MCSAQFNEFIQKKEVSFLINICVILFSIDLEEKIVDEWEEEERMEKREN